MNALADEPPVLAFRQATMSEPGVPRDWNANGSTVDEFNGESIFRYRYTLRPRLGKITLKW